MSDHFSVHGKDAALRPPQWMAIPTGLQAFSPGLRVAEQPLPWDIVPQMWRTLKGFNHRPRRSNPLYQVSAGILMWRSAGFQTCCIADFQVGSAALRPAGLETRGTADLEVCATLNRYNSFRVRWNFVDQN
jgi:hypothetical protein